MLYPYKMTPVYKDYIWGGHNLKRLGKPVVEDEWRKVGNFCHTWKRNQNFQRVLQGQSIVDVIKKIRKKENSWR